MELSYIFPKKTALKKFVIFSQKKVFLIFQEMELSSPKLKKFSYFRRELSELKK